MALRLVLCGAPPTTPATADLSFSTIQCVSTEHILASLTDGTLCCFDLNKQGQQKNVHFYRLLRSRQPFPKNDHGVVPIYASWGFLHITRLPDRDYDNIQFVFTLEGGNKIYRTSLPQQSLVAGFFGGAPVEIFASQKEAVSCMSVSMGPRRHGLLGTGAHDGVAMVWNLAHSTGDRGDSNVLTIAAHENTTVTSITFVEERHLFITASDDEAVRVWRISDGELLQSLATGRVPVTTLQCRYEGTSMLNGWNDTTVIAGTSTGSVFCWSLIHEAATSGSAAGGRTMGDMSENNSERSGPSEISSVGLFEEEEGIATGQTQSRLVALSDHSASGIVHVDVRRGTNEMIVGAVDGTIRTFSIKVTKGGDAALDCVSKRVVVSSLENETATTTHSEVEKNVRMISIGKSKMVGFKKNKTIVVVRREGVSNEHGPTLQIITKINDGELEEKKIGTWSATNVLAMVNPVLKSIIVMEKPNGKEKWSGPKSNRNSSSTLGTVGIGGVLASERSLALKKLSAKKNMFFDIANRGNNGNAKEEEEEGARGNVPSPEMHPSVTFQTWQTGNAEHNGIQHGFYETNDADRWASRAFQKNSSGAVNKNSASNNSKEIKETKEIKEKKENITRTEMLEKFRVDCDAIEVSNRRSLISMIAPTFGNPERVAALATLGLQNDRKKAKLLQRRTLRRRQGLTTETRPIGYHGGEPPYFSEVIHPLSAMQEPTMHSSKQVKQVMTHLETNQYNTPIDEIIARDLKAENQATEEMYSYIGFDHADQSRYQGLVPIEGMLEIPKLQIQKQIDQGWLKEVDINNRPNVEDINAPLPGDDVTLSTMGRRKPKRLPRDRWSRVRKRQELQSRFTAYHM